MTRHPFPPADTPRAFALPSGADLCRALVDGLEGLACAGRPEALAEATLA